MPRALVTGGAGFIGSRLCAALLGEEHEVVCLDPLLQGGARIASLQGRPGFRLVHASTADPEALRGAVSGATTVFHLAADPEVRAALQEPARHLEQNTIATLHVLEAMRKADCGAIVFASSSTVYGDAAVVPTPETAPLKPISLYGAAKAASEAMISSYCASHGLRGVSLRFANVVGPGLSHGVIHDLAAKLRKNPRELEVLGDGTQAKSYLHVDDAIQTMRRLLPPSGYDVFNVGTTDSTSVHEIADIVIAALGLSGVKLRFLPGPEGRGWPGDVKRMLLDSTKARAAGWAPTHTSRQAVEDAARSVARA